MTVGQDARPLRILSINLFVRPPGIRTHASDFKDERIQYAIDHVLPEYDIVSFQELFAFASPRRARLIRAAQAQGFHYVYGSPEQTLFNLSIDGGLLTVSRLPIVATDHIRFPRGKYSDWLAAKGAIYTKIAVREGFHLHLFTTHTQASYEPVASLDDATARIRRQQFERLHRFVVKVMRDEKRGSDEPVVVQGDLNVDARVHDRKPENLKDARCSEEYLAMMATMRYGKAAKDAMLGLPFTSSSASTQATPIAPPRQPAAASSLPVRSASAVVEDCLPHTPPVAPSSTTNNLVSTDNNDRRDDPSHVVSNDRDGRSHASHPIVPYALPFRDLIYEQLGYHPITFGDVTVASDGQHTPRDMVLTHVDERGSCQRLDYILWVGGANETENGATATLSADAYPDEVGPDTPIPFKAPSPVVAAVDQSGPPTWRVRPVHASVVPILAESQVTDSYFTQVSDHYGVAVDLEIRPA
ncbi:hypothetical protein IWQ60_004546 [Tieghemiomyces parasiticus]|uniref:sphingomyelin phosphodiesterase n=1 Tax=Tieghemiomyces parasiticus TaxID=78921 RepID=A0A9W8AG31_9FUNG|nr:hypothetical protein IWQ60_004546 [Tieghemiomyces parasiticus]